MTEKVGNKTSVETNLTPNMINLEAEERPSAGRDKAKVERAGKGKSGGLSQELGERLDKFIEVNNQSMEDRQKVIDSQVILSNQQLETAKINNKTKLFDVYSKMLLADTSKMDDAEKARLANALSKMEPMVFPEGDSG
uniref:No apical meristem-associated C-terminal domain-containing protein n=1 Tax=Aegilops tauschii subsp. strangulata TaxID=200361 RepID=A0A453LKN1_AEGTS